MSRKRTSSAMPHLNRSLISHLVSCPNRSACAVRWRRLSRSFHGMQPWLHPSSLAGLVKKNGSAESLRASLNTCIFVPVVYDSHENIKLVDQTRSAYAVPQGRSIPGRARLQGPQESRLVVAVGRLSGPPAQRHAQHLTDVKLRLKPARHGNHVR